MKLCFGKESIELGSETVESVLRDIVFQVADDREAFYLEVAKHGSRGMRNSVAGLSPMPKEIFDALINGADSYLFGCLLANEDAAVYITQKMVDDFAKSGDINALFSFVQSERNLRHLQGIDEMLEKLAQHPEPEIRCAVANNEEIPREVIEQLAKDSDLSVRQCALENLEYRDEVDE